MSVYALAMALNTSEPKHTKHEMQANVSRRGVLGLGAAAVAGLALPSGAWAGQMAGQAIGQGATPIGREVKPVLRLAHLTDMHAQLELRAGEGLAACLGQMMAHKPELVLTGGDHVMDVFARDSERAKQMIELYHGVMKEGCGLRLEACIGNHDIFGWNKAKSKTTGTEADWGKNWSLDALRIDKRYRSFDLAGWRFVVLDTVREHPTDPNGYVGGMDDEQFEWLSGVLRQTPVAMPVLVLSHVPILHAGSLILHGTARPSELGVTGGSMCLDNKRIIHLFSKHPNVKVCLAGHLHNVERIDIQGVSYICSGAVSGHWWEGRPKVTNDKPQMLRCDEGYAMMDLFADGRFTHSYHTYGWKA